LPFRWIAGVSMMAKHREPDDHDATTAPQPAPAAESPSQMRERLQVLKDYANSLRAVLDALRKRLH
jgi:hypothetical protein